MAEITILNDNDTIVGTSSDDLFIYDDNNNDTVGGDAPDGLSIDGGDGNDTVDFVTAEEDALFGNITEGELYNSNTGVATFTSSDGNSPSLLTESTLTDVEQVIFANGTLDLSDPTAIAGQEFVSVENSLTLVAGDDEEAFAQVEDVHVIEEGANDGEFVVGLLDSNDTGTSVWNYTTVNGQTIGGGGVQVEQGTFQSDGSGGLNFLVNSDFRDGMSGGSEETFTVEVGLEDTLDDENTTTATYTITVQANDFTDNADSQPGFDATVTTTTTNGMEVTDALDGNDFVSGSAGVDVIFGNAGNDAIYAGPDDASGDIFGGGAGNDTIGGGAGNDVLLGDSAYSNTSLQDQGEEGDDGNDLMFGGDGDDDIITGTITGGTATGTIATTGADTGVVGIRLHR